MVLARRKCPVGELVSHFRTEEQRFYGTRVGPGWYQTVPGLARASGVETALHPIANTYTAWVLQVSGQAHEGESGEAADLFRL